MARQKELYSILGIDDSASDKEIQDAYDRLISSCPENAPEHARIVQAYSILSDMDKRAQYDITGKVSNRTRRRNTTSSNGLEKARYTLNTLFLAGAAITTVMFILQWCGFSTTPFYWACGISIVIKVAEYIIRLIP
ncbi:MAG: J domain-containing protein [Bacteroidaceae bacterium]|nr:DnaJ domain-containing protein [Candidatus Colenecus caballi]MCQ2073517.1 J domain-containing protein [Bacteroidaceae bacterium]